MSLPWADWQFWVVTAVAVVGVWRLVQPFLDRGDACPGCDRCVSPATEDRARADLVTIGERQGAAAARPRFD